MDPNLALLFLLIGSIVSFSHLNDEALARMTRQLVRRDWRKFAPRRREH